MNDPTEIDIEKSLNELSDEEAIAIMEGRNPAFDEPQLHAAAGRLAREVLKEPDEQRTQTDGSGNVVRLIAQQPWMRMAAALLIGVAATTVMIDQGRFNAADSNAEIASANVVYLEVFRSSDPGNLPVVEISEDEDWVALVAYPDFSEADQLHVYVERASEDGSTVIWQPIVETSLNPGSRDTVVVNVRADLLVPGLYRLRVDSVEAETVRSSLLSTFRATRQRQ